MNAGATHVSARYDPDCPFCAIVAGQAQATILDRTSEYVVFRDIDPQAPVHILVIPTSHYPTLSRMAQDDSGPLIGDLFRVGALYGHRESASGFRLVANEGVGGHQTVGHVHVHVLGGRAMQWPPG